MPQQSVYLVIHSQSLLENPKDKPYSRVATTEFPNLPARWTGHDYGNHKYTNVLVTSSGTIAEEWKIVLEYNFQQDVEIVAWSDTLETAGEQLADSVLHNCNNAQQNTEEGGNRRKTVRVTWKDSLDGNSTAFHHINSHQKNTDGSTLQITTSHWYEIIRVNLEHEDQYDAKWHEKARTSYLETSERINVLQTQMRGLGTSESEVEELDGLRRGWGYFVVEKDSFKDVMRYVRRTEKEGEGAGDYLRDEIVWDG